MAGKRLVILTPMQQVLLIPGFRNLQAEATVSYDLRRDAGATDLVINNRVRYRFPAHRMFWVNLTRFTIHWTTGKLAKRLRRKLRQAPAPQFNPNLAG